MPTLRWGMVGGGQGAFIGAVHRVAATLDGGARLVAGAFSSTPEKSLASGAELGLDPARVYPTWREMLDRERALPPEERIELVSIVTPNATHAEIATAFAGAGFHVALDKPMTRTLVEAEQLAGAIAQSGVVCGVTYNYTGYPMVKQAAYMARSGELGAIRKVFVEYHQGWLATLLEGSGQKQAAWRGDPAQSGAGALGDIGSHAENLMATVTGLEIEMLACEASTLVPNRKVDDDASVLIRFQDGAKGVLTISQVCVGRENGLSIRVHGEKGSLEWKQEEPNRLVHLAMDGPARVLTRGGPGLCESANRATRLPSGHPEGFYEAFANIYRGVFEAIAAKREARLPSGLGAELPGVNEGLRGMRFIARCQESAAQNAGWVKF